MKHLLLLFLPVLILCSHARPGFAQQGVPNGDFESWPTGNHNNPEFWDSPNAITGGFPFFLNTVVKTGDSHTGSWAAQLTTGTILGEIIPGLMSLGTLELDLENIENTQFIGLPFTDRPGMLEGYFKYATPGTDFGLLGVLLTAYDEVSGNKDSIAFGVFQFTPQGNDFSYFSTDLQYISIKQPDSINIVALSSASPTMEPGSQLILDDLGFDYSSTPVVDLGGDVGICAGQSHTFELEYVEQYTYTWINANTGEVIGNEHMLTISEPVSIEVVVQNAQGLPAFDQAEVFLYEQPGDANGDGVINILDIIAIVQYFTGFEPEDFCHDNADANQDGVINVLDVIVTVQLFSESL